MTHPPMIVFTDLDGTLPDHESYDFSPARPALRRLRALRVPVVLASSKTAAELVKLRTELGVSHVPAIVENGAGLLPTGDTARVDGSDYDAIRLALSELPPDLRASFVGFGDMGPVGIAKATGLTEDQAMAASDRQFSEPGLWTGSDEGRAAFVEELGALGIVAREGGRFLTLSFGRTKADRMQSLIDQFSAPISVALGDAPNDVEMLQSATIGVVVANPHRAPLPDLPGENSGQIRRTNLPGPQGWNTAIIDILKEQGL